MTSNADSATLKTLATTLIVPHAGRRRSLSTALTESGMSAAREIDNYPTRHDLAEIAGQRCDVIVVDLDADVEQGIRVIETLCAGDAPATVMAYSAGNDLNLMRRSMQAGAREYLTEPVLPESLREAFIRAAGRRPAYGKTMGKTLVFLPSKGGSGVTTIAMNFALALTKESGAKVVVVDLDYQLGEIALGLGMPATFSVVDALLNPTRLDREFLATLLLRHSSGLAVLAAPEQYNLFHSPVEGADKLFRILREEFAYVVVDSGTCHSHIQETLFGIADTLYLVTEMTFPALRNAHRLIQFLSARDESRQLEVVLNRFNSRTGDIDEKGATKALGRQISWRIPNGYAVARTAQDTGIPLAMADSPITRALVQMAKAACGKPLAAEKKAARPFSLFGSRAPSTPVET